MKNLLILILICILALFIYRSHKQIPISRQNDDVAMAAPQIHVAVLRDGFENPYIRIVSSDPNPIKISDIIVNHRYHLYGFCNFFRQGDLIKLNISHYKVSFGSRFPRYSPEDDTYGAKILALNDECKIPGLDDLQMGGSMNLGYKAFGDVVGDEFKPMDVEPILVEVETDRGTVKFDFTPN